MLTTITMICIVAAILLSAFVYVPICIRARILNGKENA